MSPPCLLLPLAVGIQVQVFVWCLSHQLVTPTCCMFWLNRQPLWGVSAQCSPTPKLRVWGLVRNHVMVRVNSGPEGNRRLTLAASCLSYFVKPANLPFVAADSSDKQERKWRIFCVGIRSGGGGRAFPWGKSPLHEDPCCLHIPPIPWKPGGVFICRPIFVVMLGVGFLGIPCTQF